MKYGIFIRGLELLHSTKGLLIEMTFNALTDPRGNGNEGINRSRQPVHISDVLKVSINVRRKMASHGREAGKGQQASDDLITLIQSVPFKAFDSKGWILVPFVRY
jgi:hypothetical protein